MFGIKKNRYVQKIRSDKEAKMPVLRCSICNGEQVAGLKDRQTGAFEEIMLVRNAHDLDVFRKMVGVQDIPKEY